MLKYLHKLVEYNMGICLSLNTLHSHSSYLGLHSDSFHVLKITHIHYTNKLIVLITECLWRSKIEL